jgi:hypothetical protein
MFTNDLCFILNATDAWLVSVLNSPLMWPYMWRNVIHGKDEVLRLKNIYMEALPIAGPDDATRAEAEPAAARLMTLNRERQVAVADMVAWLRLEFGVEKPGQRLEALSALDEAAFVEEVRKARPRAAGRLTPAALRDLRAAYAEHLPPIRADEGEARRLEARLAELVYAAYGLTPAEIDLLWRTAPPRMPGERPTRG